VAGFELQNIARYAMWGVRRMVGRHRDAVAESWMLGVGHRGEQGVMSRVLCRITHNDVRMRRLATLTELLSRYLVVNIARRDRCCLSLVHN